MYIVTIQNGDTRTEIHGENEKVLSGKIAKGINTIDSFALSLHPSNAGFNKLHDFKTLVYAYNTRKQRFEFYGRVLYSSDEMSESGLITKEVTCESFFGFFCDSVQKYFAERNWTVRELFTHIITVHNGQVEDYKKFNIGNIAHADENVYIGIQRAKTWDVLKEKILGKLGGELRFRVVDGALYIDYFEQLGEEKTTSIAVSKNMKSIIREKNPSEFITRLIPYGAKLGDGTEDRVDITAANGGKNYIDDAEAIEKYGIHVGFVEFDDVTLPENLLAKGTEWLANNNKVKINYKATALDLSLLGLDIHNFEIYNSYPLENHLLGIDDTARIIKENIDICEEVKSTVEFGEKLETLNEIQTKQAKQASALSGLVEIPSTVTGLQNDMLALGTELSGKVGRDENDQIVNMLNASAEVIYINANRLVIESDYFSLAADGSIEAQNAKLSGRFVSTANGQTVTVDNGEITLEQTAPNGNTFAALLNSANFQTRASQCTYRFMSGVSDTNNLAHVGWETGTYIWFLPDSGKLNGTWNSSSAIGTTSDARKKHDIAALGASYSLLFNELIPRVYRYNDGTSKRLHVGFIAQEVETAIAAAGLSSADFAGFMKTTAFDSDTGKSEEVYCLRYEEFIALCVNEIQALKKEIGALKNG